jgi:hypothetical protein
MVRIALKLEQAPTALTNVAVAKHGLSEGCMSVTPSGDTAHQPSIALEGVHVNFSSFATYHWVKT